MADFYAAHQWDPCVICRAMQWYETFEARTRDQKTIKDIIDTFVVRLEKRRTSSQARIVAYYDRNALCPEHEADYTAAMLRVAG